jgi:hypothetical protein
MKNTVWIAILLAQALLFSEAHAYKEPTHQIMSQEALRRSEAGAQSDLYRLLGISFSDGATFLGNGAFNEDSLPRPTNHFYNPITEQGIPSGRPSPNYILEPTGTCSTPTLTSTFSFNIAQECFSAALTDSSGVQRRAYARIMFEHLGHVLHHVQDMAQPQHTRLDEHCDIFPCKAVDKAPGVSRYDPSLYEVAAQNWQNEITSMADPGPVFTKTLKNSPFSTPRDFWKNTNNVGFGLAEFSNSNFTTKWTNFTFCKDDNDKRGYCDNNLINILRLPSPNLRNTSDSIISKNGTATPFTLPSGLPGGDISITPNRYVINTLGVPMGSASLIYNIGDNLYQDDIVYRGYFNTLIPKALAYSEGMINFHFRGDVSASLSDKGTVIITNPSQFDKDGKFGLYADAADGTRSSTGVSWAGKLAAGQSVDTGIVAPDLSTAVPQNQGILVFDGAIGNVPRQVAGRKVTLVKIPPPPPPPTPTPPGTNNQNTTAPLGKFPFTLTISDSVVDGSVAGYINFQPVSCSGATWYDQWSPNPHHYTACGHLWGAVAAISCSGLGCADIGKRYALTFLTNENDCTQVVPSFEGPSDAIRVVPLTQPAGPFTGNLFLDTQQQPGFVNNLTGQYQRLILQSGDPPPLFNAQYSIYSVKCKYSVYVKDFQTGAVDLYETRTVSGGF